MSQTRMITKSVSLIAFALAASATGACARPPDTAPSLQGDKPAASAVTTNVAVAAPPITGTSSAPLPVVAVYKTASCGCCGLWVGHMQRAGFPVEVHNLDNVDPIKERLGVPLGKTSCHTAEVGGYFVEGHVPAEDVKRLLAEKPAAKGLVLPGMPAGSPGMETPDGQVQPYVVELVGEDGNSAVFAQHDH